MYFHTLDFFCFAGKERGREEGTKTGRRRERKEKGADRERRSFYVSVIGEIALIPANRENGAFCADAGFE